MTSPFKLMQSAVDIVNDSPHPTNKVAATLAVGDYVVSRTNGWPEAIERTIGREVKIGNSSGTVHAETVCILEAAKAQVSIKGAALFITDPPCPNCAKNIAEAGVKALYLDHKGFFKDFAQRRGEHFTHMSMKIFEKAGVSVYEIFRKEERLETIWEAPEGYEPEVERPTRLRALDRDFTQEDFVQTAIDKDKIYAHSPYAVALVKNANGQSFLLSADAHPVIGYTSHTIEPTNNKYSFTQRPLNRLLMEAAERGLAIQDEFVFTSICPTARELVNFVGAGFKALHIDDQTKSRDEFGPRALEQLVKAGALKINQ